MSYEITGVRKVVVLDGCKTVPDNVCPVVVAAVQPGASFTFQVDQLVLWQKAHLAIPNLTSTSSRGASSGSTEHETVSPPSATDHETGEEPPDRLANYALQCAQLGVFLM